MAGEQRIRALSVVRACVSCVVAVVLIYAASVHLNNPYAFLSKVYSYDILSEELGYAAAILTPSMQLTVGIGLVAFPKFHRPCFALAGLLLFAFALAQSSAHFRGLNIACGCFSAGDNNPISEFTIMRSFGLSVLCLVGLMLAQFQRLGVVAHESGDSHA